MARILIACSTVDGHTRTICQRIEQRLAAGGHGVTLRSLEDVGAAEVAGHDKVVVGASIRYGKHRPNVLAFANEHATLLAARPSAFFSVNIVARKPQKNSAETNPYVLKFLQQVRWRPTVADVFAGKLDYPRYGFFDRQMIRLIMLVTHGPTDPNAVVDFTDWARVDAFAQRVGAM
jgi:menaquinone-dependent protoporphyrinogen oxidase